MNRIGKGLALSLSFLMLIAGASASFSDTLEEYWHETAPEYHETVCESFAGWVFKTCLPYKLDGGFADGSVDTVHNGIYTDSAYWKDGRETVTTETSSHLNQTYGMGMADAKLTAIQALNNGSDEAEASSQAIEELDVFYSQQQSRLYNWKDREVLRFNSSLRKIKDTDGLLITEVYDLDQGGTCETADDFTRFDILENNVTLFNGTQISTYGVEAVYSDNGCTARYTTYVYPDLSNSGQVLRSKDVDQNDTIDALDGSEYSEAVQGVKDTRQRAIDNTNGLVSDIYSNVEPGEHDPSDLMGPLEALITSSTSYEDTGYYSYRALALEQAGYASNDSYAFKLEWQNSDMSEPETATGQLFVEKGAYNDTIETGTTYNAENVTAFFVHEADGGAVKTALDGTFTPQEMTDTETGETVNSTSLQSTKFYSKDTSELEKQLADIREDYQELQGSGPIAGFLGDAGSSLANLLNSVIPGNYITPELLGVTGIVGLVVVLLFV